MWLTAFALCGCNDPTTANKAAPIDEAGADTAFMEPLHVTPDTPHVVGGQPILMSDLFYLTHPSIPDSAKLLYTQEIKPFDDTYTFSVFDSLETTNDSLLPFYFYTTLIISEQSDGALSEMVGLVIHRFAMRHPKTLMELLKLPNLVKDKTNRDIWLQWTLTENGIGNEGHERVGIQVFGEAMLQNSPDAETEQFTKQYVSDLNALLDGMQTNTTAP